MKTKGLLKNNTQTQVIGLVYGRIKNASWYVITAKVKLAFNNAEGSVEEAIKPHVQSGFGGSS